MCVWKWTPPKKEMCLGQGGKTCSSGPTDYFFSICWFKKKMCKVSCFLDQNLKEKLWAKQARKKKKTGFSSFFQVILAKTKFWNLFASKTFFVLFNCATNCSIHYSSCLHLEYQDLFDWSAWYFIYEKVNSKYFTIYCTHVKQKQFKY